MSPEEEGTLPARGSHWSQHARRWQHIGSPLRPCAAELEQVRTALARHFVPKHPPGQALLCGVTPELAQLPLPAAMNLVAFDQSQAMLDAVWPGDTAQRRGRVGDWLALDVPAGSVSIALGDGCFSTLDYPGNYQRFAASLSRVLHAGGLFSIRLFCRPERSESVDAVLTELLAGRVGNFHVFKWRLAMALQGDETARGVRLDLIWRTFQQRLGSAEALAQRLNWPVAEVLTIDSYRDSPAAYTFSTVAEVVALLAAHFELLEEWRGDYELAERCPQLLFRRC